MALYIGIFLTTLSLIQGYLLYRMRGSLTNPGKTIFIAAAFILLYIVTYRISKRTNSMFKMDLWIWAISVMATMLAMTKKPTNKKLDYVLGGLLLSNFLINGYMGVSSLWSYFLHATGRLKH